VGDATLRKISLLGGPPDRIGDFLLPPTHKVDMLVRLTKKLAEVVNGIDISFCSEGDVIELPEAHALLLIAERWAEPAPSGALSNCAPVFKAEDRAVAADRGYDQTPRDEDAKVAGDGIISAAELSDQT
jgi:hypothetical protein